MLLADKSCKAALLESCVEKLKCGKRYNASSFFFFVIGSGGAGKPFGSRESHFPAERAVAQNFMSAHPTVIEICQCRTEWWTDTETQPSPLLRARQSTSPTRMPISCSVSLPHCVILLLSAVPPSAGPARFAFICRQEVIFANDRQALISTQ